MSILVNNAETISQGMTVNRAVSVDAVGELLVTSKAIGGSLA